MGSDRPKMSLENRAKQFLPFAAVRGLEEALEQKRRELLFEEKIVLSPDGEAEINSVLSSLKEGDKVKVKYHDGWSYQEEEGLVLKEDEKARYLVLGAKTVPFDDILRIEKQ